MLSNRLLRVYEVLQCLHAVLGYPPSLRELAAALGYAAHNMAWRDLGKLRRRGLVTWQAGASRTMRVV